MFRQGICELIFSDDLKLVIDFDQCSLNVSTNLWYHACFYRDRMSFLSLKQYCYDGSCDLLWFTCSKCEYSEFDVTFCRKL